MPPLPDPDPVIRSPAAMPPAHPQRPSPSENQLALEVISGKEFGYLGYVFGVDTPFYVLPLGWGEWVPALG